MTNRWALPPRGLTIDRYMSGLEGAYVVALHYVAELCDMEADIIRMQRHGREDVAGQRALVQARQATAKQIAEGILKVIKERAARPALGQPSTQGTR